MPDKKVDHYFFTGERYIAVYEDGTSEPVSEGSVVNDSGNTPVWMDEVVVTADRKESKAEQPNWFQNVWQNGDAQKNEQARQSWNKWMPQNFTDYSNPDLFKQLGDTSSGSATPKVLQSKAIEPKFDWQDMSGFSYPAYDGPDYNRDIKLREQYLNQWSKEISPSLLKIVALSGKWNDKNGSNVEWTTNDILKWKCGKPCGGGNEFLFKKKSAFVKHYKNVINDAANEYNIPVFLLAGVAFSEYGGDPMWIDDIADEVRKIDRKGPDWVDENMTITKDPDLTSYGNISIQIRRAAETLDYEPQKLTVLQRNEIVYSLKDPIKNIYIAAKHLYDLKQIDFANKKTNELTEDDIKIIATRYNRGPDLSIQSINKNLSYGNSLYKHKNEINNAIKQR